VRGRAADARQASMEGEHRNGPKWIMARSVGSRRWVPEGVAWASRTLELRVEHRLPVRSTRPGAWKRPPGPHAGDGVLRGVRGIGDGEVRRTKWRRGWVGSGMAARELGWVVRERAPVWWPPTPWWCTCGPGELTFIVGRPPGIRNAGPEQEVMNGARSSSCRRSAYS
jgi:hypothetical protein